MWNNIGRWSESKISETLTSDTDILVYHNVLTRHHSLQGYNEWGIVALKFWIRVHQISLTVFRLKGLKLHYSKMGF
jgi:hypothetical protein